VWCTLELVRRMVQFEREDHCLGDQGADVFTGDGLHNAGQDVVVEVRTRIAVAANGLVMLAIRNG
jgi:hypothetical protein